jgi:hypothetical protein
MRPGQGATGNQGEAVMTAIDCLAGVGAIALLILSLVLAGPARADDCQLRMGPYASQSAAELGVQQARGIGFKTSGIWGEGDVVSQIANRQYFFNVLFGCRPN